MSAQVAQTRRPQRAAAARKRAKKRMSGSPSAKKSPPGAGREYDSASKTRGCSVTMWWVGPRHTEIASTSGTSKAMVTTHQRCSK
jgi:hypothetical protein